MFLESHTGRETTCFDIHGGCRLILRDEDVTKFAIDMKGVFSGEVFHAPSVRIDQSYVTMSILQHAWSFTLCMIMSLF